MAVATDNAQDISFQAGFKVLHHALVKVALGFHVDTLDTIVIPEMMITTITEAEVEQATDQAVGETDAAKASLMGVQVAAVEGNIVEAPIESRVGETEVTPATGGAEAADVPVGEVKAAEVA